jgi:hypothetical protein
VGNLRERDFRDASPDQISESLSSWCPPRRPNRDGWLEIALVNAAQLLVGNQSARRSGSVDAKDQCDICRQSRAKIAPLNSGLLCNFGATGGSDLSPRMTSDLRCTPTAKIVGQSSRN